MILLVIDGQMSLRGRSDTRAALRQFFGVDAQAVAKAARFALGL